LAHFARNVFSNKIRFKSDSLLPADTYAVHTYMYMHLGSFCRSHEERSCDWIYVRDISRKSDRRGFCRLKVANPWRTLHNGRAQVRSRAIKNGPPRFRAWIIPLWANWNCRHDFRIYIAKLSSFVMRRLLRPQEWSRIAWNTQTTGLSSSTRITQRRERKREILSDFDQFAGFIEIFTFMPHSSDSTNIEYKLKSEWQIRSIQIEF